METYNSASVENFVKTIYQFGNTEEADTRSGTIARELGITNAAATDMARKLAAKKLVVYEKYKDLSLTQNGKKLAVNVIRRHRLWETFLHRVLGLSLHEIHMEAELLEHATSGFLLDKIDNYLGNPDHDPHGEPIPDKDGTLQNLRNCQTLSSATAGSKYEICRLVASNKEFYDFCSENHLHIGSHVLLNNQYAQGKMTEIMIQDSKLLLNNEWSRFIFVKAL